MVLVNSILIAVDNMFTDQECLKIWDELCNESKSKDLKFLLPVFAITVLHKWGWPNGIHNSTDKPPPRCEPFLAYHQDTGWISDYWGDEYIPTTEEIPLFWLPTSLLPIPYKS